MTSNQPNKLVLFDIDGTLLHCGSSARESLGRALTDITGEKIELRIEDVAGYTDLGIIKNALSRTGLLDGNPEAVVEKVGERYLEILEVAYPERDDQYLYPGIPELLERLKQRSEIRLALLTGNLVTGAKIKLAPFDIWEDFAFGAFGSDSIDRNELPVIAWEKAERLLGESYDPEQTLIVGDTPRDAICAHQNGAKALIVNRRPEWRDKIYAEKPLHVVHSTEEVDIIYQQITEFYR
ncbi:MAG: HAD hydrolase-like protein [Candidatus Marinimicrobia bacterium]|nr:HAD hydrolase-like protein [Candidatus Neomarinimicrobiota bacterium]MCF7828875.1 HAD hydrolase-like protein [Candidatus Neomarinimicrobiota bacterium]MCF7880793.1 HAD hydrolase-like protein [Candidatus Neomarinimicrobiota bacterium]